MDIYPTETWLMDIYPTETNLIIIITSNVEIWDVKLVVKKYDPNS